MEIIKNVPQPSNPLKSFNWSKIPEQKLQGTIWSELDDTKLYNVMDLESIDKIFCAYQKNGVSAEGSIEDLRTLGKNKKTMSVIDSRRAQNCTILLSKLKMSDNEITRTILSMDQQNILHIDMVEQLLKYIPSSEEAALLDMHQKELQSRADCFLYQISKYVYISSSDRFFSPPQITFFLSTNSKYLIDKELGTPTIVRSVDIVSWSEITFAEILFQEVTTIHVSECRTTSKDYDPFTTKRNSPQVSRN